MALNVHTHHALGVIWPQISLGALQAYWPAYRYGFGRHRSIEVNQKAPHLRHQELLH